MSYLRIAGAMVLLLAAAARLDAQPLASSFDEVGTFVRPGDKISVTDVHGESISGRIAKLSPDALMLMTGDGPRQLRESDVALIRQRRDDSLLNGAIIGAVAGAGYFATIVAILHGTSDGGDVIVPTAIAGASMIVGMGAAAGVGIDALITRRQVIYRKSGVTSGVRIAPLFGNQRQGVALTVTF